MFRLLIKYFAIIIALVFASCGFIDLRPIDVKTEPGKSNAVLPGEYSPLYVSFNTVMEKKEAENLLMVSTASGNVEGDIHWAGNTLIFVPLAGWIAGTRYTLGLSGLARSADGRELRIDKNLSFFALNRSPPPFVEKHYPQDGESVKSDVVLNLRFSEAMDRISVESSMSVDGMGDKKFEWSEGDKAVAITPDKNFLPWTVYRWKIAANARSKDGVPLVNDFTAFFSTDLDREIPEVKGVFPALQSNGKWFQTGGSLEERFGPGLGLIIEFSKPMGESALRSLRFEPSLAGRTEMISEKNMVFIPTRDPDPCTVYTMIISGEARDTEGLKIGADYRRVFIPDIPYLEVLSVNPYNGIGIPPAPHSVLPIQVSDVDDGVIRFTIHFSQMFSEESKQKTALSVSLVPFFPSNLSPIALRFASWFSDDMLSMEWERLGAGTSGEPRYYRLIIPGGRGGVENGGGIYLSNDVYLILEAIK